MTWSRLWSWQDMTEAKAVNKAWRPSKAAERRYAKQLLSVAGEVSGLLGQGLDPKEAQRRLKAYGESLDKWAEQAAANMIGTAKLQNEQTWRAAAQRMGIDLKSFLGVDIQEAVQARVEQNILLIKSIPFHAAQRVGELAQQAVAEGTRAQTLVKQIAEQGNVAMSRARTIALTEVSKAQTAFTQARAQGVGSEGYIWRTTRDGQRRSSHAAMEGRFVHWDKPPTLDGMTGHAGEFPNCRCYCEPVVPDSKGQAVTGSPLPTMEQETAAGRIAPRSHWEKQDFNPIVPHQPGAALHNVEHAVFDRGKLADYSMNSDSERGANKARVWKTALGMDKRHAREVERQVMAALADHPVTNRQVNQFGEKFRVIVPVTGPNGRTVDVTTAWIYDRNEKTGSVSAKPRLTTCYVR